MARILKKDINTSFFHIMVQGINKERIFNCNQDINRYLKIIKETKEKVDVDILAYCIMNNHAHFLLYDNEIEQISKFMHHINLIYAKFYNKKYERVGHVFRDRYKMQPIFTEKYLYTCVKYIHNNPVKAKICDKPEEYKYSSYQYNMFNTKKEIEIKIRQDMCFHNLMPKENESFEMLEIEENKETIQPNCEELIQEFLKENKVKERDLRKNKEMLKMLVLELSSQYAISYRMMENVLGISRETLRMLAKNKV